MLPRVPFSCMDFAKVFMQYSHLDELPDGCVVSAGILNQCINLVSLTWSQLYVDVEIGAWITLKCKHSCQWVGPYVL